MNSRQSPSVFALDAVGSNASDDARIRHESEQAAYAALTWLVSLPLPQTRPHELPKSFSFGNSGVSADWRSGAGEVTSDAADASEIEGGGAVDASAMKADKSRVMMDAHTEALGKIRLIVDRDKNGVSVVLAVEERAVATADIHRTALQRALEGAGLNVASVQIARLTEDGLAIAPSRLGSASGGGDRVDIAGASSVVRREIVKRSLLNTVG